ncbi:MAG: DUF1540 domain-containing protein [Clostridia bacterium]|nr:DUF1540 domain-containing protein [Clostridia bacterium]
MEKKCANHSIECTVHQCSHHCENENYCALNKVRIATHEPNPTQIQCVDCESFELANKSAAANG